MGGLNLFGSSTENTTNVKNEYDQRQFSEGFQAGNDSTITKTTLNAGGDLNMVDGGAFDMVESVFADAFNAISKNNERTFQVIDAATGGGVASSASTQKLIVFGGLAAFLLAAYKVIKG